MVSFDMLERVQNIIVEKSVQYVRRISLFHATRLAAGGRMRYEMVLFDLDGTLLPMDMQAFMKGYFKELTTYMAPYGYEGKALVNAVWDASYRVMANDGSRTNEEVFWQRFSEIYGEKALQDRPVMDRFYYEDFNKASVYCGRNDKATEVVKAIKARGGRVALATNPFFPRQATATRLSWTGLDVSDFELVTTYENSHFCKPSLSYYREVLSKLNVSPSSTLMVGNDAKEDMAAKGLGMDVFLITDCLENSENLDITQYPQGSFSELEAFLGL